MKRINKQIAEQYEIARKMAVDEMIRIARKILKEHPYLDEFVIAMGTCFFTQKKSDLNISLYEFTGGLTYQYFKPLADLLYEWNDTLKLTGEGIRFRFEGEIITHW